MLRFLGVTAHPDDEVGAFGGSLLLYHLRGVETYVICLTPGQAATHRGQARSDEELAEIRRFEFAASCSALHVSCGQVLNYPDGKLSQTDFHTVVGDLTRRVREIKPHVIMTMGPEGAITGHMDHAMASIFATMSYHWAARTDCYPEQLKDGLTPHRTQKLYYSTASFVLPGRPPISPPPHTAVIDITGCLDAKINAFRAHASQGPLVARFEKVMRLFGARELFHLAATNRPSEIVLETDLAAGLLDLERQNKNATDYTDEH